MDQALELLGGGGVADLVADVVGDVLEDQRHHVELVDGALHGLGHERTRLGLTDGVGDGIVLEVLAVIDLAHVGIIGAEIDLARGSPEVVVEIAAVAAVAALVHRGVVDHDLVMLWIHADQAEGDVGVECGLLVAFVIGVGTSGLGDSLAGFGHDLAVPRDQDVEVNLRLVLAGGGGTGEGRGVVQLVAGREDRAADKGGENDGKIEVLAHTIRVFNRLSWGSGRGPLGPPFPFWVQI